MVDEKLHPHTHMHTILPPIIMLKIWKRLGFINKRYKYNFKEGKIENVCHNFTIHGCIRLK